MTNSHYVRLVSLLPVFIGLSICGIGEEGDSPLSNSDTVEGSDSCWVAFAPTNFDPESGIYPDDASLTLDLETLHDAGFEGLVTYASDGTLNRVPRLAREAGFEGKIIMGVYYPTIQTEIDNAVAESAYVDAYCVGNEGLTYPYGWSPYTLNELEQAMNYIRDLTGKPVTTSEPFFAYLGGAYQDSLLENSDFLFAIVHPYWAGITEPQAAVNWTVDRYQELVEAGIVPSTGDTLDVILKEVGLPSGGDPDVNEENQARYYDLLQDTGVIFFYFEAYDQPWKDWEPVESHWGLFDPDREPKEAVRYVCGNRPPFVIEEPIPIHPNFMGLSMMVLK